MKAFKNLFRFDFNYLSRKSRLRSAKLALKTDLQGQKVTDVANKIDKYLNEGL